MVIRVYLPRYSGTQADSVLEDQPNKSTLLRNVCISLGKRSHSVFLILAEHVPLTVSRWLSARSSRCLFPTSVSPCSCLMFAWELHCPNSPRKEHNESHDPSCIRSLELGASDIWQPNYNYESPRKKEQCIRWRASTLPADCRKVLSRTLRYANSNGSWINPSQLLESLARISLECCHMTALPSKQAGHSGTRDLSHLQDFHRFRLPSICRTSFVCWLWRRGLCQGAFKNFGVLRTFFMHWLWRRVPSRWALG